MLAPENYSRYEPFVALVANIDAKTLVSFYRGLEPLFQESYEDLGNLVGILAVFAERAVGGMR
ncbi:hypothetical protein D3C83_154060 [compost metagenome]